AVELDPVARRQQHPVAMELDQLGECCRKLSSPVDVQLTRLDDQSPGLPSTHRQISLKLTNLTQICVTAATRPSTLGCSACASTRKPLPRATSEVAGPIVTAGTHRGSWSASRSSPRTADPDANSTAASAGSASAAATPGRDASGPITV